MQELLSFLRTPPEDEAAPIWAGLARDQRTEIVAMLARLIAKAIACEGQQILTAGEEADDE